MAKAPILGNDPFKRGAAERSRDEKPISQASESSTKEKAAPNRKPIKAKRRSVKTQPGKKTDQASVIECEIVSDTIDFLPKSASPLLPEKSESGSQAHQSPATVTGLASRWEQLTRVRSIASQTISTALQEVFPRIGALAIEGIGAAQRIRKAETKNFEVDQFGEEPELLSLVEPLLDFLHDQYFRIEAKGLGNIPPGPSIIVCNHSGVLPVDGLMIRTMLRRECRRPETRWLIEDALFYAPIFGSALNRLGAVRACPENAERLLNNNIPLIVFPEGLLGTSKPIGQRYQLQRFGRGGFVKLAIKVGLPIIPVAVVGAEEASPLIAKLRLRTLGFPFFPVTPTFPLLGPLGLLPLPSKWRVSVLDPVDTSNYSRSKKRTSDDPEIIDRLTAKVRQSIQFEIDKMLAERKSIFS